MTTTDAMATQRPSAASDRHIADHNLALLRYLEHRFGVTMSLKKYKLIKSGVVSLALTVFAWSAITQGADPTTIAGLALVTIALINGFELSEFFTVWLEVQRDKEE